MSHEDYQAAVDYVLSFADYERLSRSAAVFDLSRIEALLERLGSPHLASRSVHVAGTKGKGSTSAMIASVLTTSGYVTGLYTSPHLLDIRERIQVNGTMISEDEFTALVLRVRPEVAAVNRQSATGELTTFEMLTALAFAHFREKGTAFQVLEVGLGGRLDATNVIRPAVCVITSISLDHTEVLGNTIALIAAEKAGIIKPGTRVVCAPQSPEAAAVVEKVCREIGADLIAVERQLHWERTGFGEYTQSFHLAGLRGAYDLTIPLLGEHQLENAAAAVAALEVLANQGTPITAQDIVQGLSRVSWPGRLQVLQHNPLFIIDGAHNEDSARKLVKAIRQHFRFGQAILIVGISRGKNMSRILAELASLTKSVIVTRADHPRAESPSALAGELLKVGVHARVADSVPSAIELALAKAKPEDIVCATGSLFVVAEAIRRFQGTGSSNSECGRLSDVMQHPH
ncbi:MAG: bifunctional folylpolyglutamate synthase/dihydrofolate synthase [Chloroflexi bacterium]|nr:bifunctional folylpolyglutamate synthase/dihydrofolate synthase [Chloroflexota bacterium]